MPVGHPEVYAHSYHKVFANFYISDKGRLGAFIGGQSVYIEKNFVFNQSPKFREKALLAKYENFRFSVP